MGNLSPGLSTQINITCHELTYLGPTHPLPTAQEQGSTCALSPCLSHIANTPVLVLDLLTGSAADLTHNFESVWCSLGSPRPVAVTSPALLGYCRTVPSQRGCLWGGHPRLLAHLPLRAVLFLLLLTPDMMVCLPWQDSKWLYSSVRDILVARSKINLLHSVSRWFYLKHVSLAWLWQSCLLFKPFQLAKKQTKPQ